MASISNNTLFELFEVLLQSSSNPAESCDEIFLDPIRSIYKKLCRNEDYNHILGLLKSRFPTIFELTEKLDDIAGPKLVELYVDWILFMLQTYSESLNEITSLHENDTKSKNSPDILSVNQSKTVRVSLDRVFLLGISLQLYPGVGFPISLKCTSDPLLKVLCPHANDTNKNVDFLKRTINTIIHLYEIKESDIFRNYIVSHHFNTYLAALLQLSYAPDLSDGDFKKYMSQMMLKMPERLLIKEVFALMAKQPKETFSSKKLVPPPKWLVFRGCLFLKSCITKSGGVKNCILSLIEDLSDAVQSEKHMESVACLIANFPLKKDDLEEYQGNIIEQILEIIREAGNIGKVKEEWKNMMMIIVVNILEKLSNSSATIFKEKFLKSFLSAIIACSNSGIHEDEIVSENEISSCIEKLHELLVIYPTPNSSFPSYLLPFAPILFQIYMFTSSFNASYLNTPVQNILVNILKGVESWRAVSMLKYILDLDQSPPSLDVNDIYFVSENVKFTLGSSGGIKVLKTERSIIDTHKAAKLKESQQRVSCLLKILSSLSDQEIAIAIFLASLREFAHISCQEMKDDENLWDQLVSTGAQDDMMWLRNFTLLSFISDFVEVFCDLCSLKTEHIFPVCQVIMERSISLLKAADEVDNVKLELQNEILSFAVGLLTSVIIESKQMTPEKWYQAEPFVPLLRYLSSHHLSQEIRVISYELMEAIATHGKISDSKFDSLPKHSKAMHTDSSASEETLASCSVQEDIIKVKMGDNELTELSKISKIKLDKASNNSKVKLIEEVSNNSSYYEEANVILASGSVGAEFQEMLKNVTNFLEPIKGAGLIKMKKLINSKNVDAERHKSLLLKICRSCLCHEDSYVFLGAVEVLSSLASRHPEFVLPMLMEDYVKNFEVNHVEVKLKLGESLVKAVRLLGDMAVTYRDRLLSTLLHVLRDKDETIQSSAVSNLAEVCKLLRFSLSSCLYEIFDVVQNILKFNKSVEVRRAAALLTTQILQGTSKETIHILGDFLPEFYRLLKYTYKTDCDHIVQLHIQLSLQELDAIMRDFLFPKPTFEKKIFVLDPPSF